ncbi:MAG: NUDIX domain-containing protein [Pseudomonadales bacterium]|jgi:8-oxo-dGTP pyrophosphatase MutT (NUDIX family)|nr:NUDIX domain-containing protein [Pseudomonadales bacterium]MDP6470926.1 NUDIX domain-containing protein [Pseudomonadales bacterium]MDP6825889.1 NUDIX domain-containing protein [Pseudomonadales bacterium]MDP6972857.1 NUDIX domain-containing protein [Pseudomonadales bacterium]|tara:strand:+ start:505 stop:1263 length:759 start_codon:yes stop_codon:yes gene_type:complete
MEPLARENIRLAASVLLVRDTHPLRGMEVFMVQRPGGAVFPNLHVFPGGKVDEVDFQPDICSGIDDAHASELLGVSAGGIRYWVAVVRECFEECGVLLARRDGQHLTLDDDGWERFHEYRHELVDGRINMGELCARERLILECEDVLYFSHWLTPGGAAKRFDTRFFVAAMPHGQEADPHEWETQHGMWIEACEALTRHAREEWQMISPTLVALESIDAYDNVADLLADVRLERHNPPYTEALRVQGMQLMR